MVIGIIGTIIGLLILGAGLYYLKQEKNDPESKKIYGITSAIGAAVTVACAIILFTNI